MMGTGWEVKTYPTPSVITTLSGAGHLGEVNSWSGSQKGQEKNRVKSSSSKRTEQEGRGQTTLPNCFQGKASVGPSEQDSLRTILHGKVVPSSTWNLH